MKKKRVAAKAKTSKATPEALRSAQGRRGKVNDRCQVLTSLKVMRLEGEDPDLVDLKDRIHFENPDVPNGTGRLKSIAE